MHELIVKNARLYPMSRDATCAAHDSFAVDDGRISAIPACKPARRVYDARNRVVLPGLIDCHTHALYAGDRMDEHRRRLAGATYADIAAAGGGIASTVRAVRGAGISQLVEETLPRLSALAREGVTTVEIKSGYGLTTRDELKMLDAINTLPEHVRLRIIPTFLGAHTIPPGIAHAAYVDNIINEMLPAVANAKLSELCDIYIESIAFNTDDARRILERARQLGFGLRAHTEQLSHCGGTQLATELGALSCDHLEYANETDAQAMHEAGSVAVLLPGAYYFLRESQKPPTTALRSSNVRIAVASDLNPGTSPIASLLTAMHMATVFFGLSAEEALLGVTRHAACALGRGDELGSLEVGKRADFGVWDIPGPAFLVYRLGGLHPEAVFIDGVQS